MESLGLNVVFILMVHVNACVAHSLNASIVSLNTFLQSIVVFFNDCSSDVVLHFCFQHVDACHTFIQNSKSLYFKNT